MAKEAKHKKKASPAASAGLNPAKISLRLTRARQLQRFCKAFPDNPVPTEILNFARQVCPLPSNDDDDGCEEDEEPYPVKWQTHTRSLPTVLASWRAWMEDAKLGFWDVHGHLSQKEDDDDDDDGETDMEDSGRETDERNDKTKAGVDGLDRWTRQGGEDELDDDGNEDTEETDHEEYEKEKGRSLKGRSLKGRSLKDFAPKHTPPMFTFGAIPGLSGAPAPRPASIRDRRYHPTPRQRQEQQQGDDPPSPALPGSFPRQSPRNTPPKIQGKEPEEGKPRSIIASSLSANQVRQLWGEHNWRRTRDDRQKQKIAMEKETDNDSNDPLIHKKEAYESEKKIKKRPGEKKPYMEATWKAKNESDSIGHPSAGWLEWIQDKRRAAKDKKRSEEARVPHDVSDGEKLGRQQQQRARSSSWFFSARQNKTEIPEEKRASKTTSATLLPSRSSVRRDDALVERPGGRRKDHSAAQVRSKRSENRYTPLMSGALDPDSTMGCMPQLQQSRHRSEPRRERDDINEFDSGDPGPETKRINRHSGPVQDVKARGASHREPGIVHSRVRADHDENARMKSTHAIHLKQRPSKHDRHHHRRHGHKDDTEENPGESSPAERRQMPKRPKERAGNLDTSNDERQVEDDRWSSRSKKRAPSMSRRGLESGEYGSSLKRSHRHHKSAEIPSSDSEEKDISSGTDTPGGLSEGKKLVKKRSCPSPSRHRNSFVHRPKTSTPLRTSSADANPKTVDKVDEGVRPRNRHQRR